MKQVTLLIAILSTFIGTASAATSVTLYGRVDVGYESKEVSGDGKGFVSSLTQERNTTWGNSRYGIRGEEDLGNGYAATFQLEGRFEADTGSKTTNLTFFDRESTVGLKTPYGQVRVGRSIAALEQAIGYIDVGRRYTSITPYDLKTRHSNGLFYNYKNAGFSAGAEVTTKGGYNDGLKTVAGVDNVAFSDEGVAGKKVAYGVFAKYKAKNFGIDLGYQDDGIQSAGTYRREWAAAASYTFAPITVAVSYASGKDDVVTQEAKIKNFGGFISAQLGAKDVVNLFFRRWASTVTPTGAAQTVDDKVTRYGLGYIHSLSKRTSVYADVAHNQKKNIAGVTSDKYIGWDVALRHTF